MMSNLPQDLVEEILSRVPITSLRAVRSTCKRWNSLSKDPSFTKKLCAKEKEIMMIIKYYYRVYLMSVNLHNHKDLIDHQSIKEIGKLDQVEIFRAFHCDGLLLCLTTKARLVVWNPYLGQTRWIKPRTTYDCSEIYGIGYDNNNNHKILRVPREYRYNGNWVPFSPDPYYLCNGFRYNVNHEIYDFKSNSWKVLTGSLSIEDYKQGVSVKGNTYFFIKLVDNTEWSLLCFDFTRERFGPSLPLPFHQSDVFHVALSAVREEQLAVLYHRQRTSKLEIWITSKIESNAVSWNNVLAFDTKKINRLNKDITVESFFVDEEKKVAVICFMEAYGTGGWLYDSNFIIGEDGYFEEVLDIGGNIDGIPVDIGGNVSGFPIVCSYYVPSLVQINQPSSLLTKKRKWQ